MKSIDTYLCKQPKKEFSFSFYGVDYFVGDKISEDVKRRMTHALIGQPVDDTGKDIKLARFINTGIVDCVL